MRRAPTSVRRSSRGCLGGSWDSRRRDWIHGIPRAPRARFPVGSTGITRAGEASMRITGPTTDSSSGLVPEAGCISHPPAPDGWRPPDCRPGPSHRSSRRAWAETGFVGGRAGTHPRGRSELVKSGNGDGSATNLLPCPAGGRHNRRPEGPSAPGRGRLSGGCGAMAPFVSKVRTDPFGSGNKKGQALEAWP